MESDSDFECDSRRGGASLKLAINRARRYIKKGRVSREGRFGGFAGELAEAFPCHSRAGPSRPANVSRPSKKRKIQKWKFIPVCLQSPLTATVPTKGVLDSLCKLGLGSKWFSGEDKLALGIEVSSEEFHFVVVCLFPPLRNIPYEVCKATGPGHSVLIPLAIDDESLHPRKGLPFRPVFSVSRLKEAIGRKGKLYIRPMEEITFDNCRRLSDHEVKCDVNRI